MRNQLMMVAYNIAKVVQRKKMLAGTRTHILIELRDEGVLGQLDRGVRGTRRDNEAVNRKKFTIIEHSLRLARSEGLILLDDDNNHIVLGAPHVAPPQAIRKPLSEEPWNIILDDPDFDNLPPLSGAIVSRLRSWGWGTPEELVSN